VNAEIEMSDRQFSIPKPSGMISKPDEKPSRIMIDCFGSGEYLIDVRGKSVRFDWSDQFGPLPINKDGSEALSIKHNHPFWRAVSLWNLQGRRLEGNRAIWHEPRKPVYELKDGGGRNRIITKVIDPGEPGHDW
jgi:hypothetical protein